MTRLLVSHYMPADHGTHVDFILPWTQRVSAACPSLEFDVVCEGSELGKLEDQYEQVISGVVDIAHSPASLPRDRFPLTNLMNLPFLVHNAHQASERLWNAHGDVLAAEFSPLHVLALHSDSGGVLHMRQPVRTLDDLIGKRIRTPVGAIADAVAALGAVPVHILPPRIGEAARSGEIDGATMAWDVLAYTGTDSVFRYHYEDVFYVSPLYFVMNPQSYARLRDEERAALDRCSGKDLAGRFGDYWQAWSGPGRQLALAKGHSLKRLPAEVLAAFQAAAETSRKAHVESLRDNGPVKASDAVAIFSGKGAPALPPFDKHRSN